MTWRSIGVVVASTVAALTPMTAQVPAPAPIKAPAVKAKPWTMPRTPDGHPDLQGPWSNGTITRLERGRADRTKQLDQPSNPDRPAPPKGGDGSTGAAGNVGGYNNFWLDPGERVAVVVGQRRRLLSISSPACSVPRAH